MRSIHKDRKGLVVGDDPEGVIAALLHAVIDKGQQRSFEPGGDGFGVEDVMLAYEVADADDVPPSLAHEVPIEDDVWIIEEIHFGDAPSEAWLRGPELRALLAEAKRLLGA